MTKLFKFYYVWPATHSLHLFFSLHLELIRVTWLENDADYYVEESYRMLSLQSSHNRGQVMNYFSGVFLFVTVILKDTVSCDDSVIH